MMRESMLPTANISARAGYTCPDLAEPYKAPPATETPDPSAVLVTSLWEAPKEGLEVVPLIVEGEDAGLWTVPVQEEAIPGWWLVHVYALPGSKVAFTQVAVNATEPRPVTVVTVEHDGTPRIGTASEVLELLGSKVLRDKHAEEQRRLTVALAEEAMERRRLWEQERAAASAVPPTVEEPVLGQNPTPEGSGDDAAEVSPEELVARWIAARGNKDTSPRYMALFNKLVSGFPLPDDEKTILQFDEATRRAVLGQTALHRISSEGATWRVASHMDRKGAITLVGLGTGAIVPSEKMLEGVVETHRLKEQVGSAEPYDVELPMWKGRVSSQVMRKVESPEPVETVPSEVRQVRRAPRPSGMSDDQAGATPRRALNRGQPQGRSSQGDYLDMPDGLSVDDMDLEFLGSEPGMGEGPPPDWDMPPIGDAPEWVDIHDGEVAPSENHEEPSQPSTTASTEYPGRRIRNTRPTQRRGRS